MHCPKCNAKDTRVIDSRLSKNGHAIRRRRECQQCGARFSTIEETLREGLIVRKRDGRSEPFDRTKIQSGLNRACEKRPIDIEQIDMLVSDVIVELEAEHETEIPSEAIGNKIMQHLKNVDKIAYVRFASVYKDFRDIEELEQAISVLKNDD